VEKYGAAKQATDENILQLGKVQEYRHAYNISYVLLFYSNSDYVNAPHCYIKCISPVLFKHVTFHFVFPNILKKYSALIFKN
jgi:hypothetical protein